MPSSLANRTIALAEGRQLEELAAMLEREGAHTLRCPLLSIFDSPDPRPVLTWLKELIAQPFAYVVFLTGEGLRRLVGLADRTGIRAEFLAALEHCKLVTRGPKPVRALKEVGLNPTLIAEAPTTDGVVATLKKEQLTGLTVGVQLYPDAPTTLADHLQSAGATVRCVWPYVYAPKAAADQVAALIHSMADGKVDAIVFTSSPQVDRLVEVAKENSLQQALDDGWLKTKVAAIGPVVAAKLRQCGVHVDICLEQGFVMKNLVQHVMRALAGES